MLPAFFTAPMAPVLQSNQKESSTTSYKPNGAVTPNTVSAAATAPPDTDDIFNLTFDDMELDFDLGALHTVVSAVPTARVNLPKLLSVEGVFDWIADIQRYVALAEQQTPVKDMADKIILALAGKDDPVLIDFKTLLAAFRAPGVVEDSVKTRIRDSQTQALRDRTAQELVEAATENAQQGKSRVGRVVGPSYSVVERPEQIWEWLEAFVEGVYLDEARVNHYRDILEDLSVVMPPLKEGLPAANTAFNGHIVKVKALLKLSKTRGATAQRRALLRTLRNDQALYREGTRGVTWEEITQLVRRELDSRISSYNMGHSTNVNSVAHLSTRVVGETGSHLNSDQVLAQVAALEALGYKVAGPKPHQEGSKVRPVKKERERSFNGAREGRNGRGPYNRHSQTSSHRSTSGRDRPREKYEGTCHWCGLKGHTIGECQIKKAGQASVFPPKPADISWADHKAAHAKK